MNPKNTVLKTLARLSLGIVLVTSSAHAASSQIIHLQPGKTIQVDLEGTIRQSIYETREVPDTCYHTELRQETRRVCDLVPRRSCDTVPVCRDVMRPICSGTGGCRDVPTRECTNEQRCTTHHETVCHHETVTVPVQIPYACTRTETVKVGEQVVSQDIGHFAVTFKGDGAESAQDTFEVHVGNGVDVSSGFGLKNVRSSGDHLFFLKRVNDSRADAQAAGGRVFNVEYEITAVSIARLLQEHRLRISSLAFNARQLSFTLAATPAPNYSIELKIQKDKLIGGLSTILQRTLAPADMQISVNADGSLSYVVNLAALGVDFNNRPHVATVTAGLDLSSIFVDETLLNPGDEAKLERGLNATASLRKKKVN